jgi:streptogramin lyase
MAISASTLSLEEADLYPYSSPYELHRGTAGDVYLSDAGVGVWHVSASGAYTTYQLFADALDARPDGAGDIWYTDAANVVGRLNVDEPTPTRTEWVLGGTYGLWGLTIDGAGRVWITQEAGPDLYRFNPATTEWCTYTLEAWSTYVVYQDGALWVANWGADRIRRVDPAGQVRSWSIPWSGARPLGLVADAAGSLWWADRGLGALVRLEPAVDRMTRYDLPLGTDPRIAEVRADRVWYTEWTAGVSGTVGVLDPAVATGISTTVGPVDTTVTPQCDVLGPGTTTAVPDVVLGSLSWVSDTLLPALDQDGWVIYELAAAARPYGIAASGDYVWVADRGRKKLVRLQPYVPPPPGIDIEKRTNGLDADAPPGPTIVAGDPVTWTYLVTNTGGLDLDGVTVVDDNGTPGDPGDDYQCSIGLLPAGTADVTTCVQVGTAVHGPYENRAEATGDYAGTPVTDTDLSHYVGVSVTLDLEKHTNGLDADAPPGPAIVTGDPVTWTYLVTNTGGVDLAGVVVVDDNGTPGDPGDDYVCNIGLLPAGTADATTCVRVGTAAPGPYENRAEATGAYAGTPVTDTDLSHYVGVSVTLDLEKHTNGLDADAAPGPAIVAGDPVTWTYLVTNTGDVDLTGVVVVDDNGTPGDPGDDYLCNIGLLPAGTADVTTCVQVGVALAGPYENQAQAAGDSGGTPVVDVDLSHYVGVTVALDLEKYTNGVDADAPPGPAIVAGDPVMWTYVVTNTGDVELAGVTITDDAGTPGDPSDDYVCAIGTLPPGGADGTTCALPGLAAEGPFENVAVASGSYGGRQAQDADASHYLGIPANNYIFLPLVWR